MLNSSGMGPQPFDLVKHVQNGYEAAQAQHSKILETSKRLEVVRSELDSLAKLGDSVQVEDVVKGAGALVGAGFSPQELAQLLSSMPPQGGQGLQAWIQQQDKRVQQMEQSLRPVQVQSALRLGGAAMAQLHVNHAKERVTARMSQQMPQAPNPSNQLQSVEPPQNA